MMQGGEFDKRLSNGTIIAAPDFTSRVLRGVPVLFQFAEWLAVIAVFQYADKKLHFLVAKVVWILLGFGFAFYAGVFTSNLAWRYIDDPFDTKLKRIFMSYLLPLASGLVVFFLIKVVLSQIVEAH